MTRSLSTVQQSVNWSFFLCSFPKWDSSIDQMLRMFIPVLLWGILICLMSWPRILKIWIELQIWNVQFWNLFGEIGLYFWKLVLIKRDKTKFYFHFFIPLNSVSIVNLFLNSFSILIFVLVNTRLYTEPADVIVCNLV